MTTEAEHEAEAEVKPSVEPMFYIRDARGDVGNCILWWCPGGHGYTCELDKAGKFTKSEAFGKRETDIPVPVEVADAAAIQHVRSDIPAMYEYARKPKRRSSR